MSSSSSIYVEDLLEAGRPHPRQLSVVALCTIAMLADGFDMYLLGPLLPDIAKQFGVGLVEMTSVLFAQQLGVVLGAFVVGPLSDRFGRRLPFIVCVAGFGALTLAGAWADSMMLFTGLRFATGLFLAGIFPNAVALASEYAPIKYRPRAVTTVFTGYLMGVTLGAAATAILLAQYGWQGVFIVGGVFPLLLLPLLIFGLPESVYFLARRKETQAQARRLLQRLGKLPTPSDDVDIRLREEAAGAGKADWRGLFERARRNTTFLMWAAAACNMTVVVLLTSWLPTFFYKLRGVAMDEFASQLAVGILGAIVGTATSGWVIERFGSFRVVAIYAFGASVMLLAVAVAPVGTPFLIGAYVIYSFFLGGMQAGLNVLNATLFPTSLRSTALGWTSSVSRLASLGAPALGGFMLAAEFSLVAVCAVPAGFLFLIAVLMPALARASRAAPVAD